MVFAILNRLNKIIQFSSRAKLTLKSGPSTADPADPNSNALSSCGRILCLQYC